jgi:hypothetical protein
MNVEGPKGIFGGDEMRLSPMDNSKHGNIFTSDVSSRTFNAGTAELLRNVLGGPNPYDYKSKDGDTLTLSHSSKKQVTSEDILTMAQKFQSDKNDRPSEQIAQTGNAFFAKYASESGKGTNAASSTQVPDSVKTFFKEHSANDLRNMSLDQIPDDVKDFIKTQLSSG